MGSSASWAGGLSNQSGTATGSGAAETCNAQTGQITTESLTTAAAATSSRTLTNSFITANSLVFVSLAGGTNTTLAGVVITAGTPTAGSVPIKISNGNAAALNGTVVYNFLVL